MDAGLKLKRVRECLQLRYRQVEQASNLIAEKHNNLDFAIGLSRLADIENKGVVPSIHRIYSLSAIYRLDIAEVLDWYGVKVEDILQDSSFVSPSKTHLLSGSDRDRGVVTLPLKLDPGVDLTKTTDLSRFIQKWGKVPISLLANLDIEAYRYAVIGSEDYLMFPLLRPGALVQIDEGQRKIQSTGWTHEFERPIYCFELRDGFACCWCNLTADQRNLILQPHQGSPCEPIVLNYPNDLDIIGRVVGVAQQFEVADHPSRPRKRTRSSVAPVRAAGR